MIITATPLRISLLGGNTDFPKYFLKHGGACLTMAIDKYIYCIVKERFDDQIWINYSKKEIVNNVDDIEHDLVRECLRLLDITKGLEISFLSDIPADGSGLGSSSAVTVGLLNALHRYIGESVSADQLANEAVNIEVNILKKPIGIQDQFIAAYGGLRLFEFGKDGISTRRAEGGNSQPLLLFYTGITRKADDVLVDMKLNKKILSNNKKLVYRAVEGEALGPLLAEYWSLKKKLNPRVTNPEIDAMYDKAIQMGATGGKIVGAGGGGFLLLCVPPSVQRTIRDFGWKELPFNVSKDGSKVIFDIRK